MPVLLGYTRGEVMIKFEHNMLVLNGIMTKEDVSAINEYSKLVRKQTQEETVKFLEGLLEERSGINLQGAIGLLREYFGTSN